MAIIKLHRRPKNEVENPMRDPVLVNTSHLVTVKGSLFPCARRHELCSAVEMVGYMPFIVIETVDEIDTLIGKAEEGK